MRKKVEIISFKENFVSTNQSVDFATHKVFFAKTINTDSQNEEFVIKEQSLLDCATEYMLYQFLEQLNVAIPPKRFIVQLAENSYALATIKIGVPILSENQLEINHKLDVANSPFSKNKQPPICPDTRYLEINGKRHTTSISGLVEHLPVFIFITDHAPLGKDFNNGRLVTKKIAVDRYEAQFYKIDPGAGENFPSTLILKGYSALGALDRKKTFMNQIKTYLLEKFDDNTATNFSNRFVSAIHMGDHTFSYYATALITEDFKELKHNNGNLEEGDNLWLSFKAIELQELTNSCQTIANLSDEKIQEIIDTSFPYELEQEESAANKKALYKTILCSRRDTMQVATEIYQALMESNQEQRTLLLAH